MGLYYDMEEQLALSQADVVKLNLRLYNALADLEQTHNGKFSPPTGTANHNQEVSSMNGHGDIQNTSCGNDCDGNKPLRDETLRDGGRVNQQTYDADIRVSRDVVFNDSIDGSGERPLTAVERLVDEKDQNGDAEQLTECLTDTLGSAVSETKIGYLTYEHDNDVRRPMEDWPRSKENESRQSCKSFEYFTIDFNDKKNHGATSPKTLTYHPIKYQTARVQPKVPDKASSKSPPLRKKNDQKRNPPRSSVHSNPGVARRIETLSRSLQPNRETCVTESAIDGKSQHGETYDVEEMRTALMKSLDVMHSQETATVPSLNSRHNTLLENIELLEREIDLEQDHSNSADGAIEDAITTVGNEFDCVSPGRSLKSAMEMGSRFEDALINDPARPQTGSTSARLRRRRQRDSKAVRPLSMTISPDKSARNTEEHAGESSLSNTWSGPSLREKLPSDDVNSAMESIGDGSKTPVCRSRPQSARDRSNGKETEFQTGLRARSRSKGRVNSETRSSWHPGLKSSPREELNTTMSYDRYSPTLHHTPKVSRSSHSKYNGSTLVNVLNT